jgi:Tfp pilus assembly protein PilV
VNAQPAGDDHGETLIEVLMAVVIMGIAVVSIIAGIGTAIVVSDIHHKQATAGAAVRDYAEALENSVAASPSGYSAAACGNPSLYAVYTPPSGYTATVLGVRDWNDSAADPSTWAWEPAGTCVDHGVQKVSLRVASTDSRATETLDVIIRRPCRQADWLANPCS